MLDRVTVLLACGARKKRAALGRARGANVGRHASFAGRGMQARPSPSSRFQVLEVAVAAVGAMRQLVATIRRHDRDLGEQVRRAASSVALNIAEGNRNEGGLRLSRFSTAAGSNAEVRAALRVAVAWGYVGSQEIEPVEELLDRVAAMLHRLGARR